PSWTAIANRSSPNAKMAGCYAALVGPGMRCGFGMGCGGAEEEAVDKLLSPLKNSNRLRHLSIIASNRSSTSRSCNKRSTVAVFPISTNSYMSPSSFRASSLAARIAALILLLSGKHFREFCPITISSKLRDAKRRKILLAPDEARHGRDDIVLERSYRSKFGNETLMQFLEVSPIFPWEDSGRGVAAVFEGWVNLIYWSWHGTLCTSNHTLKDWEIRSRSVLAPSRA